MVKIVSHLMAIVGASCLMYGATLVTARADECALADSNFVLEKDPNRYLLMYRKTIVAQISPGELNDLYGGKRPDTSCHGVISTHDLIAIVVGWQGDLLIAYGITRDANDNAIELNKLGWAPHANGLSLSLSSSTRLEERGNGVQICWNEIGDGLWTFGSLGAPACLNPLPSSNAMQTVFTVKL